MKKIFLFLTFFSIFLFLLLLIPQKALAMFCQEGGAYDSVDKLSNKGVVGNTISISYWYFMDPGDVILSRYIYDGRNWVPATLYSGQPGGLPNEMIRITTTYSEAKDYRIAGGIVYKDASGQMKTFTCSLGQTRDYLRIFESETKNLGSVSLYYPETKTLTITGKNPYVGYFRNSNGAWRGDFLTYQITPNPSSKTWDWKVKEGYNFGLHCDKWGPGAWTLPYSLNPNTVGADLLPYPNVLPTQLTLEFTSPVFNPGQGTGAYAIYDYTNVVVYSRTTARNTPAQPPCLPGNCATSTSTPTQTPTPTSMKVKNPYCPSFGFYPYGPFQDKGGNGNADSLPNTYSKYVPFTAPFTGKVNGITVKAGNWGGAWRTISCKITNANGTVNISQEASAGAFRNDSSVQWRKIAFPTQFDLTGGQQYRLYCRGSDAGMVYWIYDPTKNANNDLAKLYGRTYAVCMQ